MAIYMTTRRYNRLRRIALILKFTIAFRGCRDGGALPLDASVGAQLEDATRDTYRR
jgi:hypothetical protein